MKEETGGPAFPKPRTENGCDEVVQTGMTLRDYFAGQAMQTLITRSNNSQTDIKLLASNSYKYADAVLKERNK